jgi:hypothetical protein
VILRLLCALGVVSFLSGPLKAQTANLAHEAQVAFTAGQVELARVLALAALNDDPRNPTALAVLAGVGLATNEPLAARQVAGQSFRAATDKRGKFTAARLAARASVDLGQSGIAKYWLRRAVQVAPTEEARTAALRDFVAVRSQSPMRLDVSFSIKPSDNVNQGAEDTLLTIDGHPTWFYFDPSTMALSGVEATASLGLRYRIAGTAAVPTELGLRIYHRDVTLSSAAKALAPDAKGSDFANSALEVMFLHKTVLSPTQSLSFGVTLSKSWLAGDPYSDRARAEVALTTVHGAASLSRFGFAVERQWLETGSPAVTAFTLDAGLQHRLGWGDVVALKVELGQMLSDDPNQEQRRIGASLRYAFGQPVAGAGVSAALSITARDHPVFFNGIFNDTGRQDLSVSANLDLALPQLGLFGFEPVLSLEASRTDSNISRYSGKTVGVGLRVQSSF